MPKAKQIRLKALLSKKEADRTEAEKSELLTLQAEAKAANWNPETDAIGDDSLTENEVQAIVLKALGNIGLDSETVSAIKASLTGKSLTADDVSAAIQQHLGGAKVDPAAIAEAVRASLPAQKGITSEELDAKLADFAKNITSKARHEFPAEEPGANDYPIEHRNGNLTVAQKQLLNLCLMHVSDEAIANSNCPRPRSLNDGITEAQLKTAVRNGALRAKALRQAVVYAGKAITAGGAGSGAELVNTDLSTDLLARLYLESLLSTELMGNEIDMPSNPFQLPMTTTRPAFYVGSEGGTPTNSDPGTSAPTLDAKKLIGQSSYSYEADEDSIIAILPMLQQQLGSAAADALEGALINGDTTGTHQDSDIAAVSLHYAKLFKGFRKYAIAGSLATSLASGGISTTNIGALKKAMGKYGIRPRDVIIVAGIKGYNDLVMLPETLTADKVGSNVARVLTGEAPVLLGMRIIPSEQVREDLNASGVYDGCTTTKGSIFLVHKPSFLLGVRRGFTVEVDVDKRTQMNYVVASFRRAFQPKETPSATVPAVVMGYNYTS